MRSWRASAIPDWPLATELSAANDSQLQNISVRSIPSVIPSVIPPVIPSVRSAPSVRRREKRLQSRKATMALRPGDCPPRATPPRRRDTEQKKPPCARSNTGLAVCCPCVGFWGRGDDDDGMILYSKRGWRFGVIGAGGRKEEGRHVVKVARYYGVHVVAPD